MSTNTYEHACILYRETGRDEGSLQKDIAYYARVGYVFIAPDYVLLGERIGVGWHIYVGVGIGAIEKFCELMPYWLPFIGWERPTRGRPHKWHRTENLMRRLGYDNKQIDEFQRRKWRADYLDVLPRTPRESGIGESVRDRGRESCVNAASNTASSFA